MTGSGHYSENDYICYTAVVTTTTDSSSLSKTKRDRHKRIHTRQRLAKANTTRSKNTKHMVIYKHDTITAVHTKKHTRATNPNTPAYEHTCRSNTKKAIVYL